MMYLLPISLLWFDDTCAALFKMICYAMIGWMLGCGELYARCMLGVVMWWDAWLDVCWALFDKHDRWTVRDVWFHIDC